MKITVSKAEVKTAVRQFKRIIEDECPTVKVGICDVDYDELLEAINDEFACGTYRRDEDLGSALDVLKDLNDSVGLEEFGFVIEG